MTKMDPKRPAVPACFQANMEIIRQSMPDSERIWQMQDSHGKIPSEYGPKKTVKSRPEGLRDWTGPMTKRDP